MKPSVQSAGTGTTIRSTSSRIHAATCSIGGKRPRSSSTISGM